MYVKVRSKGSFLPKSSLAVPRLRVLETSTLPADSNVGPRSVS